MSPVGPREQGFAAAQASSPRRLQWARAPPPPTRRRTVAKRPADREEGKGAGSINTRNPHPPSPPSTTPAQRPRCNAPEARHGTRCPPAHLQQAARAPQCHDTGSEAPVGHGAEKAGPMPWGGRAYDAGGGTHRDRQASRAGGSRSLWLYASDPRRCRAHAVGGVSCAQRPREVSACGVRGTVAVPGACAGWPASGAGRKKPVQHQSKSDGLSWKGGPWSPFKRGM